jgi:hypothetical protein
MAASWFWGGRYWPELARGELRPVIKPRCRDRKPWGSAQLALARQATASEADILEAGDCLHSKTVGRPSKGPKQTEGLIAPTRDRR